MVAYCNAERSWLALSQLDWMLAVILTRQHGAPRSYYTDERLKENSGSTLRGLLMYVAQIAL